MSESSFIRRVLLTFWYVSATLVVLGAAFLSVARLALPMMDEYRLELQAWASRNVGYPVEVESLDISWRGFGPELQLENFRLKDDSGRVLLGAESVGLGINLLQTALAGEPRLSVASIVGTDLSLERLESGRIVLEGMEHLTPAANPLNVFLSQPRFEVKQSSVRWLDRGVGGRPWKFDRITFRMSNRDQRHKLTLKADLPVALGRQFELVADMAGPGTEFSNWSGRVYVNGRELHLDRWMRTPLPEGVIIGAVLDAELWMDVRRGIVEEISADAGVHNLEIWSGREEVEPFTVDRLGGAFLWQREKHGWRLDINSLLVEFPRRQWPISGGTLVWHQPDEASYRMEMAADFVELADAMRLAANLPFLDIPVLDELSNVNPQGVVRNLRFGYEQPDGHWVAKAVVENLSSTPHASWPGISGLHGYVTGADDRGHLVLGGTDVSLHDPARFPRPLELGVLDAEINWSAHDGLLRFDMPLFEQYAEDISVRARARLDIPAEGEPVLDAYATLMESELRAVNRYLPTLVMPGGAVKWLDEGFVSGKIASGDILFHGPVKRFPFNHNEGRFEARINVSDVILDYTPGWPRIEELDAEVGFVNLGMLIKAEHGKILETQMVGVTAEISDLTKTPLKVNGQVRGPLSEMLRYVSDSPLGNNYRRLLAATSTQGDAELTLSLNVPLRGADREIDVNGEVSMAGNNLEMADWNLSLKEMKGLLNFNKQGLFCRQLDARFLGKPVGIEITQAMQGKTPVKQLKINGNLPLVDHFRIGEILSIAGIKGESFWNLRIDIPEPASPGDLSATLNLSSNLKGIHVGLPEPYGKTAEESRTFRLVQEIDDNPERILGFSYADLMTGAIAMDVNGDRPAFKRGKIRVGEGVAELPAQSGLVISGHVPALAAGNWLEWYRAARASENTNGPEKKTTSGNDQVLRRVALQIDDLSVMDHSFRDVALEAGRDAKAWAVNVTSPDASGLIRVPFAVTNEDPLDLRFNHLHVRPAQGLDQAKDAPVDPSRIEPVTMAVDDLVYKDLDLGQMSLVATPVSQGVRVESLTLKPDWMKLGANGTWSRVDGKDQSRFVIEISSEDSGDLLEKFGYSAEMKGGEVELGIGAAWPGTPFDLAFENVEGELDLKVGEGRLVDVEPGAGRLFGLLSLHSLQRRLTLDFSDLFKKGYTFDRIEGTFKLTDANAYTDDLFIDGPSARIEISGRTGLAAHDYDQLVTVIPRVSSTLPIAGAIAGGPAVGAALLLAEKLLPEQMEKLTSFAKYHYSLTGTWESPELTRLSAQQEDTGGETGFEDAEDDG